MNKSTIWISGSRFTMSGGGLRALRELAGIPGNRPSRRALRRARREVAAAPTGALTAALKCFYWRKNAPQGL